MMVMVMMKDAAGATVPHHPPSQPPLQILPVSHPKSPTNLIIKKKSSRFHVHSVRNSLEPVPWPIRLVPDWTIRLLMEMTFQAGDWPNATLKSDTTPKQTVFDSVHASFFDPRPPSLPSLSEPTASQDRPPIALPIAENGRGTMRKMHVAGLQGPASQSSRLELELAVCLFCLSVCLPRGRRRRRRGCPLLARRGVRFNAGCSGFPARQPP